MSGPMLDDVHGDLYGTSIEQQVRSGVLSRTSCGRGGKPDIGGGDAGKRRAVSRSASRRPWVAGIMFGRGAHELGNEYEAGCR